MTHSSWEMFQIETTDCFKDLLHNSKHINQNWGPFSNKVRTTPGTVKLHKLCGSALESQIFFFFFLGGGFYVNVW